MNNDGLRKALITKDNLTFAELISICRAEDISLEQSTILRQKENENYIEKNKGKKTYSQTFNREKKFRFCRKIHNFKKELFAYRKTYSKCGR